MRKTLIKLLFLVLALCLGACMFTACSNNDGEQGSESLMFEKISGKDEYCVVGLGEVSSWDIVIPSTYKGLPVTEIGENAFSAGYNGDERTENITSIVLPNSITQLGDGAFFGCISLTSIQLSNAITSIGTNTFYNCDSLTSIVMPNSVTSIGYQSFYGCNSLTNVSISNSLTIIGQSAFYECVSLKNVVIPSSVTKIGAFAFYNCDSLGKIVIPSSVVTMDAQIFSACDNLTIYCEVASKPSGWTDFWNYQGKPVVWGRTE